MAASCTGWIEPLQLECIVINMFAGTMEIFMVLGFIAVAMLAARFKMRNGPAMLMFAMFAILFAKYMPGLYILVIIIGGIFILYNIKGPFNKD